MLDGLEVQRKKVGNRLQNDRTEKNKQKASSRSAVGEQARRSARRGTERTSLDKMIKSPAANSQNKRKNDPPRGPGVLDAASDEAKKERNHGGNEDTSSKKIDALEGVGPGRAAIVLDLEKK